MIVVGYHIQNGVITNSRGGTIPPTDPESMLDEFMEPYRMQGDTPCWKMAWSPDEVVLPLLRMFTHEQLQTLAEKESVEFGLTTRSGKKKKYRLWYPRQEGVAQCLCFTDRSDPNTPWGQWPEQYIWNIQAHCPDGLEPPKDAMEVEMYGHKILDICAKVLKVQAVPGHFFSPVNILKPYIESWGLPKVGELPPKVANYAAHCMSPPWVEAHQLGYWDRACDVDLKCYSEDTELLTTTGWRGVLDVYTGDSVLAFCPKDKRCRFETVVEMSKTHYTGNMVQIETNHVSLLATQNHRVLLQNHIRSTESRAYKLTGKLGYPDVWEVREAGDLPNGQFRMPTNFPMADRLDYPVEDELLKLIAWINTEGTRKKNTGRKAKVKGLGIGISQSATVNPEKCIDIQRCLDVLGITHSMNVEVKKYPKKEYRVCRWLIATADARDLPLDPVNLHFIPLWILQLCSLRQLELYYRTLIAGDGTTGNGHTQFYTKLSTNADRMAWLCCLLGYKVSSRYAARKGRGRYYVNINDRGRSERRCDPQFETVSTGKVRKDIAYDGMVGCPTVQDGFVVVRRKGKVFICGNSAYGTILKDLPDWRMGEWVESKDWQQGAKFGYCVCNLTIRPEVSLHPILTELEESTSGFTVAAIGEQKERFLTSRQIDFVRRWKLGEVEILDGVWWFPQRIRQPFKTIIERLTTQRENMEGDLKAVDAKLGRFVAKKMIVGLWGYTARWDWEKGKEPDPFYNPVWAAEITTRIPLRVAALIYRKKLMKHVICMAVDGFNADCEVELEPEDENLGWKVSEWGPTVCMSSHHSWMGSRKPEGLYLGDILDLVKSKPSANMWARQLTRRATLGDAMVRGNLSLLGQTITVPLTVHLKQEHNRVFRPAPRTGKDVLAKKFKSKPYDMSEIQAMEVAA